MYSLNSLFLHQLKEYICITIFAKFQTPNSTYICSIYLIKNINITKMADSGRDQIVTPTFIQASNHANQCPDCSHPQPAKTVKVFIWSLDTFRHNKSLSPLQSNKTACSIWLIIWHMIGVLCSYIFVDKTKGFYL